MAKKLVEGYYFNKKGQPVRDSLDGNMFEQRNGKYGRKPINSAQRNSSKMMSQGGNGTTKKKNKQNSGK